jgi:hypothetical protein
MSNVSAYVVEYDGTAAGLAVAEPRGFRFFASVHRAWPIDGRSFRSLEAVNAAVAKLLEKRTRQSAAPPRSAAASRRYEHPEPSRAAA